MYENIEEAMDYLSKSRKLANDPPNEPGWWWVATNPAWKDPPEVVYVGYPEYDDRLWVYSIWTVGKVQLLTEYCKKYPRLWIKRLEVPSITEYINNK